MPRLIRPLFVLVVSFAVNLSFRRKATPSRTRTPLSRAAANDRFDAEPDDPLWTVGELAAEAGVPAALVGRVACDLGFENLVFDVDEAAAILSVLGFPPPRVA
jgi:hypothetical protein